MTTVDLCCGLPGGWGRYRDTWASPALLTRHCLPLRKFLPSRQHAQRLEDPDTSLRQPWGLTYSSKAASSWSRRLRPLPPVAELSLDVDVYRSGHFETNDKQAKVRLPGARSGPQTPFGLHSVKRLQYRSARMTSISSSFKRLECLVALVSHLSLVV